MQPSVKIRKFKMQTKYPHQRSEGTRGNRGFADRSHGMWIWEWRCCGNLWELIASRRMDARIPERMEVKPKCPMCGSFPERQMVNVSRT